MDYTIGQLAKLTGTTVRALHHYEKQGLLKPSSRTPAGYRRYSQRDVLVLHRILACRQMGMGLKEISTYLGAQGPPLSDLLAKQAAKVRSDLAQLRSLLSKLERLMLLSSTKRASVLSTELLDLMNAMQSLRQHYTSDELKELHAIRDTIDPDDLQEMRRTLQTLLEGFTTALAKQTDPNDVHVKDLARQWLALGALAPASRHVTEKTRALIADNGQVQSATGISPGLKAYIDSAVAHVRGAE